MRTSGSIFRRLLGRILSLKIRTKFLLAFLLVILVVGPGVGALTYALSSRIIVRNTAQLSDQITGQIAVNIAWQAESFERFAFSFVSDGKYGGTTFGQLMDRLNRESYGYELERNMEGILTSYLLMNAEQVGAVYVGTLDGRMFEWRKNVYGVAELKTGDDSTSTEAGMQTPGDVRAAFAGLPDAVNDEAWFRDSSGSVVFARSVIDPKTLARKGFVAFVMDSSAFGMPDESRYLVKSARIAVLTRDNSILVAGEPPENQEESALDGTASGKAAFATETRSLSTEEMVRQALSRSLVSAGRSPVKLDFGGSPYIYSCQTASDGKWTILAFVPMPELMQNVQVLGLTVLVLCLVLVALSVVLAYVFTFSFTRNLKLLESHMAKAEGGDFSIRAKPDSYDEIGLLTLRFNYMMKQIHDLVRTVTAEQLEKQKAEYRMLMAQINPHFLYNTLGSIKWLANRNEQPEIEAMTKALIRLLKSSAQEVSLIAVEEEIGNLEQYVLLQKIRYDNRFDVEIRIAEGVAGFHTLKFVLQPLFENALYHGMDLSKGRGFIRITAEERDGALVMCVSDNGNGMDEATLRGILDGSGERRRSGFNSIGVRNINERIRMNFGEAYGLRYESVPGEGTRAYVVMPVLRSREEVPFQ